MQLSCQAPHRILVIIHHELAFYDRRPTDQSAPADTKDAVPKRDWVNCNSDMRSWK